MAKGGSGNKNLSVVGGGGGIKAPSKAANTRSEADFVDKIARDMANPNSDETAISNGDMQGMVEAYAAEKGLSLKDEDRLTEAIRTRSQAYANTEGINGYTVTSANGDNTEFYFAKTTSGRTLYGNYINHIDNPTPNGWTEKQMIDRVKQNGGSASKYTKNQLVDKEVARLEDRKATDDFLNKEYVRNKGADLGHKAYRNSKAARRISRRR